jgi:hypothetical protein
MYLFSRGSFFTQSFFTRIFPTEIFFYSYEDVFHKDLLFYKDIYDHGFFLNSFFRRDLFTHFFSLPTAFMELFICPFIAIRIFLKTKNHCGRCNERI